LVSSAECVDKVDAPILWFTLLEQQKQFTWSWNISHRALTSSFVTF
jgi:hypothetical protein